MPKTEILYQHVRHCDKLYCDVSPLQHKLCFEWICLCFYNKQTHLTTLWNNLEIQYRYIGWESNRKSSLMTCSFKSWNDHIIMNKMAAGCLQEKDFSDMREMCSNVSPPDPKTGPFLAQKCGECACGKVAGRKKHKNSQPGWQALKINPVEKWLLVWEWKTLRPEKGLGEQKKKKRTQPLPIHSTWLRQFSIIFHFFYFSLTILFILAHYSFLFFF